MIFNFKNTTDAKTLEGHGAEYFFPKSGGTVDGNLTVGDDTETHRYLYLKNKVRNVFQYINANGLYALYDTTNGKTILQSSADGNTNIFNGTASGNLPLTGGTLANSNGVPLILQGREERSLLEFITSKNEMLGYIGFEGTSNPVVFGHNGQKAGDILHTGKMADYVLPKSGGRINGVISFAVYDNGYGQIHKSHNENTDYGTVITDKAKDGTASTLVVKACEDKAYYGNASGNKELHHDGNSAKVVISSTAPSDTSALWVY